MPQTTRIPRPVELFNSYLVNTTAYLFEGTPVNNGTRLGLLQTEMDSWKNIHQDWGPLYVKYSDKKLTRTTAIKDKILNLQDMLRELDQKNRILDRIAASPNVTIDDLVLFNIKDGVNQKGGRSTSNTPILENVSATLQPAGGGMVSIKCYTASGQRAAIYEEADAVQYAYQVDDVAPTSPLSPGLTKDISSKACFTLSVGADNSRKVLYIYFRWYNMRHPELSGPWSALQNTVII